MLLVDDSIVRGNTSLRIVRIVRMVREAGARKVYFASSSPPLISPCPYGIDMATKTEFIATGRTRAEIAELLEVDHLVYLDREAMNAAARRGNPRIEKFCNAWLHRRVPDGRHHPRRPRHDRGRAEGPAEALHVRGAEELRE